MPSPAPKQTGSDQFMRMGHTVGPFGQDPEVEPVSSEVAAPPKEIKP